MAKLKKWLIVVGVMGLLLLVPAAEAQPPAPANQLVYDGANVLFVIDQSGSMCGTRCQAPEYWGLGTDEHDLRFSVPQYALRWLYQFQSYLVAQNPVQVNMGLFGFGEVQRLLLNWTNLNSMPQANAERLVNDISAQRFGTVNLGNTDFIGALEEARRMFESAPVPPVGQRNIKAIVLLTDGEPCASESCNDTTKQQHLAQVEQMVRAYFPDYEFYVVVFDSLGTIYPKWKVQWDAIVCANQPTDCNPSLRYVHVREPKEISDTFNRILYELIGRTTTAVQRQEVDVTSGVGALNVPPYQQFLRINFFKNSNDPIQGIRIIRPDGQVEPNAAEQGVNDAIQTYEIVLPEPGHWQVDLTQVTDKSVIGEVLAVMDLIRLGGNATITPADPQQPSLTQYTPAVFTAQIVDSGGVPLDLYPNNIYPLTVTLELYQTDGINPPPTKPDYTIPLTLDSVMAPGINQFAAAQTLPFEGQYEVRLDASYTDDAGQTQYILEDESMATIVIAPAYVRWHGIDPISQRAGQPAKLRADVLEKGTDRPLPVAAELVFRVTAIHQDGTVALDHQVLSSAPGAGMGEVWSELVLDQAGVYSLSLELGWAHDNSFETLDTLTSQFEVRPIVNLQVMVLRPADDSSEEVWLLPNLLGKTPMTVQVEIRDENNNLVSLADLTGGAETRPTVILRQGDEQEDLTAQMVEVSPGMYQTEFEHKGRGSYEIQASVKTPDLALIGDYAWNPASVTAHHERDWATAMFVGGGVILLALALAVLGTVWSVVRWKQSKQYPLNTVLVLKIFDSQNPDQEVMATIPLAPFVVNRKKFGKGDLPAPWEKLVVSTHRDPMVSDEKMFYIDEVRIGGEPGNQTQGGGSPLIVGQDRVVHRTSMPGVMVDFIVGNNTDNVFSK